MNMLYTIGGVVAAAVIVGPFLLPSSKTVARSVVIEAPSEKIFPLLASNEGFQKFNPYKAKDPELKITLSGPETGIGSKFAFDGKDGKGTQEIIAMETGKSVTMQIDLGPMGQPVTTFTLEPQNGATKVTWSTQSDFGMNPIGRVFGLFLDKMLGPDYEKGLDLLSDVASA